MRALMWVVLAIAALWSGYWFVGSWAVQREATSAFAQASAAGLMAEHAEIRVGGFPNIFDLTVTAPQIYDPATGYGWQADTFDLYAMTWKPWHLIAILPDTQVITTPQGKVNVASSKLRASIVFHPGNDLALDRIVVEGTDLVIEAPNGQTRIASASFATRLDTSRRDSHRIGLQVTDLTPDPRISAALPELPTSVTGLHLDMVALLSAPLDRHLSTRQPELTGIIIQEASLAWGPLELAASGSVAAASEGVAEGRIDLRIAGWRLLPDVLAQVGALDPVLAPTLLRAMEILAKDGTDPEVLNVPLTFKSGRMSLGPLPLGPAPRLVQRQ